MDSNGKSLRNMMKYGFYWFLMGKSPINHIYNLFSGGIYGKMVV
jgi:hypothetical protein